METTKPITKDSGGPRVKKLQKEVKEHLADRGFDYMAKAIIVDGKPGPLTFKLTGHLASMIGLSDAQVKAARNGKITPHAEKYLKGDAKRTPEMKKRERERAAGWRKLRHEHFHPQLDRDGISEWRGVLVPPGRSARPRGRTARSRIG